MYKKILLASSDRGYLRLLKNVLLEIDSEVVIDVALSDLNTGNSLRSRIKLPDIAFLDLDMPCMNGFELLTSIKENGHHAHPVIVFFTESLDPQDVEKTHQLEANIFLSKTRDSSILKEKLLRIFNYEVSEIYDEAHIVQYSV